MGTTLKWLFGIAAFIAWSVLTPVLVTYQLGTWVLGFGVVLMLALLFTEMHFTRRENAGRPVDASLAWRIYRSLGIACFCFMVWGMLINY